MTPRYRVVIHASERDRAALALNNAKNLIAGLGAERVEAEVVAYADGVEGLRAGGPNAALMDLLASYGTRFAVCANTLRSRNLTAKDFPGYVETVPSGVVELVVRQAEGWCYIRP
jgi:intracellular sulfur oxidation DsrE/DsrF family protein